MKRASKSVHEIRACLEVCIPFEVSFNHSVLLLSHAPDPRNIKERLMGRDDSRVHDDRDEFNRSYAKLHLKFLHQHIAKPCRAQ